MKSKLFLVALALTACGKPATTASVVKADSVPTQSSLCATYANSQDLVSFKSVNPLTETVSNMEKAMIQAAVLNTDNSTPVTPDEAVDIFSDKENGGSLGGTISYFKVTHNGKEKTIANTTYYPGDNEYGALFQIWTYSDGSQHAGMIGTVGDSDVYCLTPAN